MSEPNREEFKHDIKNPFSDADVTPQDRVAALDRIIADALERKKRNTLSEDEPNKVVKLRSRLNEERAMKSFHYYMQRLEGRTPLWNEMIRQLKPGQRQEITGVLFKDNSVVWSDEGVVHMHLVDAAKRSHSDRTGQIQTRYTPGFSMPQLWIYSDNEEAIKKFQDYLQRNLDPQTPLSVWVSPISIKSKIEPHEVNIREKT